ncbi:hypothetical protein Neosp_012353 [[Neocosmospora] mangrovei]
MAPGLWDKFTKKLKKKLGGSDSKDELGSCHKLSADNFDNDDSSDGCDCTTRPYINCQTDGFFDRKSTNITNSASSALAQLDANPASRVVNRSSAHRTFNGSAHSLLDNATSSPFDSPAGHTHYSVTVLINNSTCSLSIDPAVDIVNSPTASIASTTTSDLPINTIDNLAPTADDRYLKGITKSPRRVVEESIRSPQSRQARQGSSI